jgi:hypothetical protein
LAVGPRITEEIRGWPSRQSVSIESEVKTYYNEFRVHQSLNGATPEEKGGGSTVAAVSLEHYDWQRHCHGLFQLPIGA